MYIKKVVIEGFACYSKQIVIEHLCHRVNCLVGGQNSGKTNFIDAIRFVVGDVFRHLDPQHRPTLLHVTFLFITFPESLLLCYICTAFIIQQGGGESVLSASVELCFEESNTNIQGLKEVTLKRIISAEKDEYFLDNKHINKTEVMKFLERVGLYHCNPYHFIHKGNIEFLTLVKDRKISDLLEEFLGTRLFEERCHASSKIMKKTGIKRKCIIRQSEKHLEDMLKEVDEEREELRKYEQLERQSISLKYIIFEKALKDIISKLKEVLESNQQHREIFSEISTELNEVSVILASTQEYCKKNIMDMGSQSSDDFEGYELKSIDELNEMLDKCNVELKKFSHVDKMAPNQYEDLTKQQVELLGVQTGLDPDAKIIKKFISDLNEWKTASILKSIRDVGQKFSEVFASLVEGGNGVFEISEVASGLELEKHIDVKVKVSFAGQERQSMNQMSGAQKTVVVWALIFSLQQYYPSHFYLFDEIDSTLDPQYRTAIRDLIRRQADNQGSQFIITTLCPELVNVADKIYKLSGDHGVVSASAVSREAALRFIEENSNNQNE